MTDKQKRFCDEYLIDLNALGLTKQLIHQSKKMKQQERMAADC